MVTPGLTFISRILLRLSVPVLSLVAVGHFIDGIPEWVLIATPIVVLPAYGALTVWMTELRQGREAKAMGARMTPRVKGKWLGNADLPFVMLEHYRKGYPGMTF
jgi:hypothetical protein